MIKKRRFKLSKFVNRVLVVSGLFQMAVLQFHIDMINNLYSTIIGFYLFAFLLFTIINILNGTNFTAKKSKIAIGAIYLITAIQLVFGALYIDVVITEVNTITEVSMNNGIIASIGYFLVSMLASVSACICSVIYYFRKSEVDLYLG